MQTLILARHGHAVSNESELTSCTPPGKGLTARGVAQALALRDALAVDGVALGVSSELARAAETAELAAPGVRRLPLPGLNEIHFGHFEKRPLDDYRGWAWEAAAHEECPGGGESRGAAAARFARALDWLLGRAEPTILAVGHALPIRYVLDAAEGVVPSMHITRVAHAEPFRLDRRAVERAAATLTEWSDAPQFRPPQVGGR